jgi:hypothetical protein
MRESILASKRIADANAKNHAMHARRLARRLAALGWDVGRGGELDEECETFVARYDVHEVLLILDAAAASVMVFNLSTPGVEVGRVVEVPASTHELSRPWHVSLVAAIPRALEAYMSAVAPAVEPHPQPVVGVETTATLAVPA